MRCSVIQSHDRGDAALTEPKQSFLVRDDELQRYRTAAGPPDHHRIQVHIDGFFDARAGEGEVRSTVHNKTTSTLFPYDLPQASAVYAGDLHVEAIKWNVEDCFYLGCGCFRGVGCLLYPVYCAWVYISSKGIPSDRFYMNGTSGAWRHEPYMDTRTRERAYVVLTKHALGWECDGREFWTFIISSSRHFSTECVIFL